MESQDGNEVYSYRADRVERSDWGTSVWVYMDVKRQPLRLIKNGKPWKPYTQLVQNWNVSCVMKTIRVDQSNYYDAEGHVVWTEGSEGIPRKPAPDTLGDILITAVCPIPATH